MRRGHRAAPAPQIETAPQARWAWDTHTPSHAQIPLAQCGRFLRRRSRAPRILLHDNASSSCSRAIPRRMEDSLTLAIPALVCKPYSRPSNQGRPFARHIQNCPHSSNHEQVHRAKSTTQRGGVIISLAVVCQWVVYADYVRHRRDPRMRCAGDPDCNAR